MNRLEYVKRQYGIYDPSPEAAVRAAYRYLSYAQKHMQDFNFKDANKDLTSALTLLSAFIEPHLTGAEEGR